MEDLGSYLKGLRESAGISHREIYDEIRIRPDQLILIEAGQIHDLGDFGFARAIVYSYARYLNADLDSVMQAFSSFYPEDLRQDFKTPTLPREKRVMLSTNFLWSLLISVLSIILALILYYSYQKGYLKTPEFFQSSKPDSIAVRTKVPETQPDSIRTRLLRIKNSLPEDDASPHPAIQATPKTTTKRDTTDYLGTYLGDSPANIDLH